MRLPIVLPALLFCCLPAGAAFFESAQPIWPAGLEKEKNLLVGFRAGFEAPAGERVTLRVAASTLYRAWINGRFLGHGPARAAHGFYRVDEWALPVHAGTNLVAIEVAGYNVNSYYLLNQPSFVQAEVMAGGRVLASTQGKGTAFQAAILSGRVQKVQRFSFQRPFIEVYKLSPDSDLWRMDPRAAFTPVPCNAVGPKQLLPRGLDYPEFPLRQPSLRISEGRFESGVNPGKLWKDRALVNIGPQLLGFPESELEEVVSSDLQRLRNSQVTALGSSYSPQDGIALGAQRFAVLDFGTNLSGFVGARVKVTEPTTLYFTFDEILSGGDVDFKRLGTVSAVTYHLTPGTYALESLEPYTLRFLKLMVLKGACEIRDVFLREYANPDGWRASFVSSDPGLNRIFSAARETFRQNSADLFMDCPSRERAGWLCDSYFTSRVEPWMSGGSRVERNFLENFVLPEHFANMPDGMFPMCYPADHYDGIFIPNWSLWLVLQLEEYRARSGDAALVEAFRPRVMRLFDYFRKFRNQDGLLENLDSWIFLEWSRANDFVKDVNYPSNMLYAAALSAAGRLYGDARLEKQAEEIRATIRKQSFDGEFFVDNAVRKNGRLEVTRNRTETCQYYAFYFGTATPQSHPELWSRLTREFGPDRAKKGLYPEIHPANAFVGNVLRLELLSRQGLARQLLEETRSYLLYMAERTGTLWENIHSEASLNHGFASHAANVLYRDVLGLWRVDSVGKNIVVRFTDSPLSWCEGRVPLPEGPLSLRWEASAGEIRYELHVPAGYRVSIENKSGWALLAAVPTNH